MATVIDSLLIRLGFDADTSGAARFDSGLGKVIKTAGKVAAVGGAAIAGFGALVIRTAGNFEEAMNAVSSVSGAVGKDFDALRDMAKKMGSETAFSATEAANGMEYLAMAGLSTEQVLSTIPNALSLAAAGSIELGQSADILSNIMSGMGIAAEDSARVADVLAGAAAGANTNVSALGGAMKYVAPIAKTMGYSLEETASAIGILGNAGIAGEQAGTSLRAIYTRIASDRKAKSYFTDLGISVVDANGNMRSMTDIVTDLQQSTNKMAAADQIEIFKGIAGAEAMGALAVLVDGVANDSLPNLTEKLLGAKGAADKMAATRLEGFNGQLKIMGSALEGLMLEIADTGLLNVATDVIKAITAGIGELVEYLPVAIAAVSNFFQWFDDNGQKIINTLKVIGGVAAVIAGALLLMYAPAIAGFLLMKATGILSFLLLQGAAIASAVATGAAWLIAFAPFLLIGAVIAVVIGLLWLIYDNWAQIAAGISAELDKLKQLFSAAITAISDAWSGLWSGVKSMAGSAIDFVIDKVKGLVGLISGALGTVAKLAGFKIPSFSGASAAASGGKGGGNTNTSSINQTFNVSSPSAASSIARDSTGAQRKSNTGVKQ
jgi:TP901 family phage tail tape measure protein